MIKVDIDGKVLEVEQGSTIIEVADNAQIQIPRFCYHKKLSIAANCRMCLVEVINAPKPMPACATPVSEGMQVRTKSPKALMAQRAVMEFLLINHPLDCPICDQGGECELQDVSMGYGDDISRFIQGKRSVEDKNIGPLIATGLTRCILCTRCVRFGDEVAGLKEFGGVGRGEFTEIRTFLNDSVDSELSGNMIDLCPVGALTSKPYRFSARPWELLQRPGISPHDSIGANIYVHSLRNKIKRVVPKENEAINEIWLSDRDRFGYEGLLHDDVVTTPKTKINGNWESISWEDALTIAINIIQEQINSDPKLFYGIIGAHSNLEEGYLFKELFNLLQSDNYSYGSRLPNDISSKLGADNISLVDIERSQTVVLIGAKLRKSLPLLNHRIRKASLNGAKIYSLNSIPLAANFKLSEEIIAPENYIQELSSILKSLIVLQNKTVPRGLADIPETELSNAIAKALFEAKDRALLILGEQVLSHPDLEVILQLYSDIKSRLNCASIICPELANTLGMRLLEFKPSCAMLKSEAPGTYILFNVEPEYDCFKGLELIDNFNQSKVICISPFTSNVIYDYADLILPLAPFTHSSGTMVNIEHRWQSYNSVIEPISGQAIPGWKILIALLQLIQPKDTYNEYTCSTIVRDVIAAKYKDSPVKPNSSRPESSGQSILAATDDSQVNDEILATLVLENNCYRTDNIIRRASSLNETKDAQQGAFIFISEDLAKSLQAKDNDKLWFVNKVDSNQRVHYPIKIDTNLKSKTVYFTTGFYDTLPISIPYSQVIIKKTL